MRVSFYVAGEVIPYKTIYLPRTQVDHSEPVIVGGEFDLLRGEFPGSGNIQVSNPIRLNDGSWIKTGDWVRIWLDDDLHDDPIYLGEALTEGWDTGPGEIQLRGLTERIKKLAWVGMAQGDFPTFMSTVMSKTELPRGISQGNWNIDVDSTFSSNTPFELLGDTFQSIEPALGNFKLGVNTIGQIVVVNPGSLTTIRFPRTFSTQPPGNFDSFINSVRFKFQYPSGDAGFVEAANMESVQSVGRYWEFLSSETLPIVSGEEPYQNMTIDLFRADDVFGQPVSKQFTSTLATADFTSPISFYVRTTYGVAPSGSSILNLGSFEDLYSMSVTLGEQTRLQIQQTVIQDLYIRYNQSISQSRILFNQFRVVFEASQLDNLSSQDHFYCCSNPDGSGVLSHTVVSTNVVGSGLAKYELAVSSPVDFGKPVYITYSAAARTAAIQQSRTLEALLPYDVRELYAIVQHTPPTGFPPVGNENYTTSYLSFTTVSARVMITSMGIERDVRATVPQSLLLNHDGSLVTALRDYDHRSTALMVIDLDEEITVPIGSSIEFELADETKTVSSIVVLRKQDSFSSNNTVDEVLMRQITNEAYKVTLIGDEPGRLFEESVKARPFKGIILPRTARPSSGRERFAVRAKNDPDAPELNTGVTFDRILVGGYSGVTGIKIRVPKLDGISTFGASYLKYRSRPSREWSGMVPGLQRIPATGYAAFETSYSNDDELLEIQRVNYNITSNTTTVFAGSPLPASDDDSVVLSIQDLRRLQRKAGG